jgi:hypothetical protein
MTTYKNYPFLKLAWRFAWIFFVLVFVIEILFSIVKNASFSLMAESYFLDGNWIFFLKRMIFMAGFYGLFMAGYYKFIKK